MKKITVLHLDSCPYCHNAKRAIEELTAANPEYAKLDVEWIEESRQASLMGRRSTRRIPVNPMRNAVRL